MTRPGVTPPRHTPAAPRLPAKDPVLAEHLEELRIASDPNAPGHILPPILPAHHRILDIGCGMGQTLVASHLSPAQLGVGIDVDQQAIAAGAQLNRGVRFVAASAMELPFRDDAYDFVFSRVALPYTDIPAALAEIRRVLVPGGSCWVTLHPLSLALQLWLRHLVRGQIKGVVFQAYSMLNGLSLHVTGRQFPLVGRYESFQTVGGIRRALRAAGFADIDVRRTEFFVVTARRPPVHGSDVGA